MAATTQGVILKAYCDDGKPTPDMFGVGPVAIGPLEDGGILIKALALSCDPYLRLGKIKSTGGVPLGTALSNYMVGKVVESKSDAWKPGELLAFQAIPMVLEQVLSAEELKSLLVWKLPEVVSEVNSTWGTGVLGMTGATAYAGLVDVLRPKSGETIFVSSAAGSVGSMVGQIAKKQFGCTVIGSAGGAVKCTMVKDELGFDACIDYKKCENASQLTEQLKQLAPDGIDMYFENVGGMHIEAALSSIRKNGRIAICGVMQKPPVTTLNIEQMMFKEVRIEGFIGGNWLEGSKGTPGQWLSDMAKWSLDLVVKESVHEGIESWPDAFCSLFSGSSGGKVVVRV